MSIITISRGSYSRGKEVAEKLAEALGYECVSREVFLEATGQFNIPEIKMIRAVHDAPSILERFTYGKERYIAFFRAAFLRHMQRDGVVYHGLAGHFFIQGIPHVLKVRVIADLDARAREEMKREDIAVEEAREILTKDDSERRRWSRYLYGIDTWDPVLYDMVLHIKNMGVDDVVDSVLHAVRRPCFATTPESRRALDELALSAQVEAALITDYPRVEVTAKGDEVFVDARAAIADEDATIARIKQLAEEVVGIKNLHVNIVPIVIRD